MEGALTTLAGISKALASIKTLDDAVDMRDKAAALRHYAKESKQSLDVQNRASYAKLMFERKAGELLMKLPRAPGPGRGKGKNRHRDASFAEALKGAGIAEPTARRWQYLAKWPLAKLASLLATCNEEEDELTTALAISSARGYLESIERAKPKRETEPEKEPAPRSLSETASQSEQEQPAADWHKPAPRLKQRNDPLRRCLEHLSELSSAARGLCDEFPKELHALAATYRRTEQQIERLMEKH